MTDSEVALEAPHTYRGVRGCAPVIGMTTRDVIDCYVRAVLLSSGVESLRDEAKKGHLAQIQVDHLSWLSRRVIDPSDLDLEAVAQNLLCEMERFMGTYPNVPGLQQVSEPVSARIIYDARDGRSWSKFPLGTRVYAIIGGYWTKEEHGWRWMTNGSYFPTPGGDAAHVELPGMSPERVERLYSCDRKTFYPTPDAALYHFLRGQPLSMWMDSYAVRVFSKPSMGVMNPFPTGDYVVVDVPSWISSMESGLLRLDGVLDWVRDRLGYPQGTENHED